VVKKAEYMHYYQFNIGDYNSHTMHLSEIEDLTYRRLLDWYYLHESPIPLDLNEVSRQIRMRSHSDCIATVLQEFFERTADGWIHHRANKEIEKVGDKSQKASASAKARWSKPKDANALRTQSEGNATQDTVHITQDTEHKKRATVVACPPDVSQQIWNDWVALRKSKKAPITQTVLNGAIAEAKILGWPLEKFLAEWCSRGSQGLKAEWIVKPNPADKVRLTVASSNEPDPALLKIAEDAKKAAPIPLEVLAKMAELRKKA
jgi:uncharacterized protein YdaU (DUF1376 family)